MKIFGAMVVTAAVLAAGFASRQAFAQTAAPGPAATRGDFTLTERSDYSRYVDGRYIGHVYRESRGTLRPAGASVAGLSTEAFRGFEGEFYVLEETLRDEREAAHRVDRSESVRLTVALDGSLAVLGDAAVQGDAGFPSLRGLPSFPAAAVPSRGAGPKPGDSWAAPGTRALDFDGSGVIVLMPFLAEYRFVGGTTYRGRAALSLSATFATRWMATKGTLRGATGKHDLDIVMDAETLSTLFIRDRFDDTFSLASSEGGPGSTERRSGFSLYFFEGAIPLDRRATGAAIIAAIDSATAGRAPTATSPASASNGSGSDESSPPGTGPGQPDAGEALTLADDAGLGAAGLELASSPEGVVLRVKDLRFVADSDAILRSELWRLDAIAAALKALPGRSFLVSGHSAAVGKAAGELELSVKRAKRVADELAARGIAASRLLYRGFGSSRPLALNDTEEGRAKNRRVEITVLE